MYAIFKECEDMEEMTIPPKRDKRGKRHGFTRFNNIQDERVFVGRLDNIIIRNKKIFANIPKF